MKPLTRTAAFIAPAEVPEMASICQPGFFEQAVQHAPGEGAMRPAALQREIDKNGGAGAEPIGRKYHSSYAPAPALSSLAENGDSSYRRAFFYGPLLCHNGCMSVNLNLESQLGDCTEFLHFDTRSREACCKQKHSTLSN